MELILHEWQVGYLAGIIDGEGCIYISHDAKHTVYAVDVISTDMLLVTTLASITGLGSIHTSESKNKKQKTQCRWRVGSRVEIYILLKKILPFLLLKKKQAQLMLEFCEGKMAGNITKERICEIEDTMHALNKRGRV